ncbi:hypothetical protein HELRODRAFT_178201 [Helobdella robusta]|uniref:Endonuclease/exonuclease/phosphatase domain-containing protein n=1 Tax=Helobdella robusta TaxID=6412 RepID=T1FCX8_HELRO|nr:hypothetical protein HELRODRAFT_178201 [Helobdella robusta]ESN97411.1 hypothetical protein HELRODRAFT_178201 [Helobdella robusta]
MPVCSITKCHSSYLNENVTLHRIIWSCSSALSEVQENAMTIPMYNSWKPSLNEFILDVRLSLGKQNGPSMVLRLGTLNVGSLTGRSMEIAEMLEHRRIDICCLQETRWQSNGVCHVNSDKEKYKLFWNGQKTTKMVLEFLSENR